jgi:hypothetical protein
VLLPVSILASAAAVVAAGAIGGTVGSVQPVIDQPAVVNLAPGLVAGQPGTSSQSEGTGPAVASFLDAAQTGPLIQPAMFRTARFPSTP